MEPPELPANIRADAFAGTASDYLRYRPPYPRALLGDLLTRAALPARGVLLDLACGPGRVALDLAGAFDVVRAIDLEPEMIEVGRQEAVRREVDNVTWLVGRAEDLTLPSGSIDLVTIGDAFHRLDQHLIVGRAMTWLRPGGCLATLGTEGILAGREPWQQSGANVARKWMSRAFPDGWAQGRPGAAVTPDAIERVLRTAGFADVQSHTFQATHVWSFTQIVGYLRSTSVCSKQALGDDFAAFEADLRAALTGPGAGADSRPRSAAVGASSSSRSPGVGANSSSRSPAVGASSRSRFSAGEQPTPSFSAELTYGYTLARKPAG